MTGFGERLEPQLRAMPCFRPATDTEIDESHAAYVAGDVEAVLESWRTHAEPTRASLPRAVRRLYGMAGWAPPMTNAMVFLASVRAVLRAGEQFRGTLAPDVSRAIHTEFPWLERRHEHIPDGFAPEFDFPETTREFIEADGLDDARARWQLIVAINEVQQCCYSEFCADLFRLPALRAHAARERALALNYFGHWSPPCTRELWRQTIMILDGLNAAVFELICHLRPGSFASFATIGPLLHRDQWHRFVDNMRTPQKLVPIPKQAVNHA